ncbi:PREDICTED: gloverin-like [Papilio polytes]|uniref:gloverin-like n=1 Tax=Papilio polytes TaxID=76194 RepID=UPI000676A770|nr:PREDICTED: gloverin-like [Papilio polytes]
MHTMVTFLHTTINSFAANITAQNTNAMYSQSSAYLCLAILVCIQVVTSRSIDDISNSREQRQRRDVTWDKQVGKGTVFGTLGNNDQGLFGKGGYKQDIFNDNRGKLQGQAYGTRVLGATGDSSLLGGKLNWNNVNKDANAAIEITKQIHGHTNVDAALSKVWNVDKNTRFSAGGTLNTDIGRGKPDYGVGATFEHNFG